MQRLRYLDKGMIQFPGRMGQDRERLHHATQNSAQVKPYELFISGIFHLIFSDRGWLRATETTESKTADTGRWLYFHQNSHGPDVELCGHKIISLMEAATVKEKLPAGPQTVGQRVENSRVPQQVCAELTLTDWLLLLFVRTLCTLAMCFWHRLEKDRSIKLIKQVFREIWTMSKSLFPLVS